MTTDTTTNDLKVLGQRVAKRRAEFGWRQHQLATKAEVSLATVQNIENGKTRCLPATYGRIAGALDWTLDELNPDGEA